MLEVSKELQDYVRELDKKSMCLRGMGQGEYPEIDNFAFGKLLSFGALFPYADAISYNENGILVVGDSGIGKGLLVEKIQKLFPRNSQVLGIDNPTLYKPKGALDAVVYHDDIKLMTDPFFVPFLFPGSAEEFPLKYMIHLKEDNKKSLEKGNAQETANFMFSTSRFFPENPEAINQLNGMFNTVTCYDFFKPRGYASNEDLEISAKGIATLLH